MRKIRGNGVRDMRLLSYGLCVMSYERKTVMNYERKNSYELCVMGYE